MKIRQVQFVNQLELDIDAELKPVGDTLVIVLRKKGNTGIIIAGASTFSRNHSEGTIPAAQPTADDVAALVRARAAE